MSYPLNQILGSVR